MFLKFWHPFLPGRRAGVRPGASGDARIRFETAGVARGGPARAVAALMAACGLAAAGAAPARASDVPIMEANAHFDRDSVSLRAGDSLIVTNGDNGDHALTVLTDDGDPQDLGVQKPGKVLKVKFDTVGRFNVRCNLTPAMRLRVIVH